MWKKKIGFFSGKKNAAEEVTITKERLPHHVAIIMDGNGRWANSKGLMRAAGHRAGVKTLKNILKTAVKLDLEVLTVYAFSTENWKRPAKEVELLMELFAEYLTSEIDEMDANNVRLQFLGKINELSPKLRQQAEAAVERTKNNTGVVFNVAVNYGGQDEIIRAVKKMTADIAAGTLAQEELTEEVFAAYLDTAGLPPVDLVIRTSGDQRLSNFLLWQAAYAEFWFTDINWPDFTPECFKQALADYGKRERRFGGLQPDNK